MTKKNSPGSEGPSALREPAVHPSADERRLLDTLMDNTADHIYFKDAESRFVRISRALADHFGLGDPSEAVGRTDFDFFTSEHAERAYADEREVMRTGKPLVGKEEKETWPDGRQTWVSTTKVPVLDEKGRIIATFGISRDITDGKRAEETLREERDLSRTYLDIAGVMLAVVDADEKISMVNKTGCGILGYTEGELVGGNWFDLLVPARAREEVRGVFRKLMAGDVAPVEYYQNPLVRKDGEEKLISFHNTVLRSTCGEIAGVLFSAEDITDRKRAEEALKRSRGQLRGLAAGLQAVREEERTRLARKIHDELGHALTAMKMDLSWLDKRLAEAGDLAQSGPIRKRMNSMFDLLGATIQSIREMAGDLRPGVLDDLGLTAALEWTARQFQNRTGIRCAVASSAEHVELDRERLTALYRICQELLTNVARHAEASAVKVTLGQDTDQLVLQVTDNGRGITEQQASSGASLGILGMRERVLVLGGEVEIVGAADKGTTASVRIPLGWEKQQNGRNNET